MFDKYDRRKLAEAQKLLTEVYEANYGTPRMSPELNRLNTIITKLTSLQTLCEEQPKSTASEYVAWTAEKLRQQLNPTETAAQTEAEASEAIKIPICQKCGRELGQYIPGFGIICSSEYIEDSPLCHSCQIDHCLSTDCQKCTTGDLSNCQHHQLKANYLED